MSLRSRILPFNVTENDPCGLIGESPLWVHSGHKRSAPCAGLAGRLVKRKYSCLLRILPAESRVDPDVAVQSRPQESRGCGDRQTMSALRLLLAIAFVGAFLAPNIAAAQAG